MKAIRVHEFGGPHVLKLENVPDPSPGPGQVVVRMGAVGVNPVDTYIRAGNYGARPLPWTPGMDGAGLIAAVGPDVAWKVGQRVYVAGTQTGAYAELAVCSASQVHGLPDRISVEQGAAVGVPYATAYYALYNRGGARPGETVLVHGATGGVGIAAVQLARSAGLVVIGTGSSEAGRSAVLEQGAHHVVDHRAAGYLDQVMQLTGGRGVDLVLEMLANVNLGKDLTVLAPRGRVVVIGSRGPVQINPRDTMSRNADIRGMALLFVSEAELAGVHAAVVAGLAGGFLSPIVSERFALADAARAHQRVLESHGVGKIVLVP